MMIPAAAIAPMIKPLFSTCPAAPVEVAPEVGPVWVLVTVSVAVRMGPVTVATTVPVVLTTTDSEPETEVEAEVEAEPWISLVVLTGIVEAPAMLRAFELSWVAAEETVVQGAATY